MLKSFFRWLFRIKPRVIDPWECTDNLYITRFRQHLDVIASALSLEGQTVGTRFNYEQKCGELHNQSGYVLAQVRVHGEMSRADKAIVTSFSLSETERMLLVLILPIRVEFKTTEKVAA